MTSTLMLLMLAVSAAPSSAADDVHLVIFDGGKTPARATRAMKRFAGSKLIREALVDARPRQLLSDEVEGLNSGFHIAVAGWCKDESEANALRDLLKLEFPGAYVRKVERGELGDGCPTIREVAAPAGARDARVLGSRKWPIWRVTEPSDPKTELSEVRVQVLAGSYAVATYQTESSVTEGAHDSAATFEDFCGFMRSGTRSFPVIAWTTSWGGGDMVTVNLMTFEGGKIRELLGFPQFVSERCDFGKLRFESKNGHYEIWSESDFHCPDEKPCKVAETDAAE